MARPPKDPIDRIQQALNKGGVAGAERAVQRLQKQAEAAQKPFVALAAALDDERLRRSAGQMLATGEATRKLNDQARERLSLEARRQSVLSGGYGAELRASQLLNRERERVEALERRAQFGARYGRLGGLMYHADVLRNNPLVRGGLAAATGVGGAAAGAAMHGLANTVEMNRLQLEVKLVSMELAGAMLPAIRFVTRALQDVREKLEKLSPRQQNFAMLGMLGFGGLAMAGLARFGLAGLMSGAGALAGASGAAGTAATAGGIGAIASRVGLVGAAGGAALAAGAITDNPYLGMAGGAALGYKFGGPIGALIGTTVGAATSAPSDREGETPFSYWSRMRREGHDMLGSTLAMGGRSIARVFGASPDAAGGPGGANPDRRRVTIADAGLEAPGSARERMISSLALVDAKTDTRDTLTQIKDFLFETFGKDKPPAPPSL